MSTPTQHTYLNFDLLIIRSRRGYAAHVVASPAGEAATDFELPFGEKVLETFFSGDGGKTRKSGVSQEMRSPTPRVDVELLGRQLFAAVFAQDVGKCLLLSLQKAQAQQTHLRIRLRLDQSAPELAEIPWEFLYTPEWGRFTALSEETPIVRYIEQMRSVEPLQVALPLQILGVLASPRDLPPLEIEQEWQRLDNATQPLRDHGQVTLTRLRMGTLAELQDYLRTHTVHILHFIGHGFFDAVRNQGGLFFVTAANESHLVTATELATLVNSHQSLRLVFLNACEGARSGDEFFAGAAQILVQQGIPAVIAMQFPVTDEAAVILSSTFYRAITDGLPVDAALTEARKSIFAQGNGWEWGTPVFFSRSLDNALFDIADTRPKPACPYPGMVPFSEADSANFFGRAAEITDAVARLRLSPFLTVIGPSGSGKSSLVYAGVIPTLRTTTSFGAGNWHFITMRPGVQPLTALCQQLGVDTPAALATLTLAQRTLLFIDQFEETFTLARQAADGQPESRQFLTALGNLANKPKLFILLTVRADFYPELMAAPLWPQIKANRLELPPMGARELRAAIVQPAEGVGVALDILLVQQLINEAAGEPGVLPLVQETLVQLWDQLEKRRLPYSAYLAMADGGRSGLQVAIARRADVTFDGFSEQGQSIARRIFLRLVQFGEGRADTRRRLSVAELCDADDDQQLFEATLQALAQVRLLTLSANLAEDTDRRQVDNAHPDRRQVDISHEAIISGWPQIQQWLKERRESEQARRRLESKAEDWQRLGKKEGGLLDQFELREAEQWLDNQHHQALGWSQTLRDLVSISRKALETAAAEKEAAHQRELEAAQQLAEARKRDLERTEQLRIKDAAAARSRLLALVGPLGVLLIAAIAVLWLINQQSIDRANANRQLEDKNTQLAARSQDLADSNTQLEERTTDLQAKTLELQDRSNELAIALDTANTQKLAAEYNAREAIANKLAAQAQSYLINSDITSALTRARDAIATTLSTDGYVAPDADLALRRALGLYAFRSTLPYFRHVGGINAVAHSPDGTLIVSASDDRSVRLWAYPSGHHVRLLGTLDGGVETVAFSPDGAFIAAGGQDKSIRIWRIEDGALVQTLTAHTAAVRAIAFAPQGQHLVSTSQDGTVIIWDMERWQPRFTLTGHTGTVYAAAFSPDGRRIASVAKDGQIRLWDVETGAAQQTIMASNAGLRAVAFSPDGTTVAAAGDANVISLWETASGTERFTLAGHEKPVQGLAISHDGRWLVSAADDATLKLWDLQTAALVRTFHGAEAEPKEFNAVAFSADERTLISAGVDRTIRLWEVESGAETNSFPGHVDAVLASTFSPDSRLIATVGSDQQIRFWDVRTGMTARLVQTQGGRLYAVAYHPNGRQLITAGEAGLVRLWDINRGTAVLTLTGHVGDVTAVAVDASGARIVSGGVDGTVRIWDAVTGEAQQTIAGDVDGIHAVAINPAGSLVVGAGADGLLRIWRSQSGEVVGELEGHKGAVDALAFSADGAMIASAGEDQSVRVWSVRDRVLLRIFIGHTARVRAVTFGPDNKRLASGGDDRTVRLWNVERGEAIRILFGHADVIRSLAFSPDGNTLVSTAGGTTGNNSIRMWVVKPLAERFKLEPHDDILRWATFSPDEEFIATACEDGKLRIWNGENEQLLQVIDAHQARVRTVAFSHDSRLLVSAGDDKLIHVWEVGTWANVADLVGHTERVRSAFFSPDGKLIVSASEDKSVRLWNAQTGAELHELVGHQEVVVFATFSPDGQLIASAGFDGTVRLWETRSGALLSTFASASRFNNIVAFSPDGTILAAGSGDADNVNQVQFWQVATGAEAHPPLPHSGPVRGIAFSPDGKLLLTAGHGNPVQLWELAQNRAIRTFTEHEKSVWSVNFSTDGKFFITASEDRTARVWFTSVEAQVALANELLRADPPIFSPEMRTQLVNSSQ